MTIKDYFKMLFTNPNSKEGYELRIKRLKEITCQCGHINENHKDKIGKCSFDLDRCYCEKFVRRNIKEK